jgi:hypothetical protein
VEKPLVVTLLSSSDEITDIELLYGGWNLGMLSVQADDLADIIEGLREGFHVVIARNADQGTSWPEIGYPAVISQQPQGNDEIRQADIQSFVDELDEEDD